MRFKDAPKTEDEKIEFMNEFFHARYPDELKETNDLIAISEHERYIKCIDNNMIHKCSCSFNGCLDKNKICKRGYMTNTINSSSSFDEKGYPKYIRKTEKDLKVVPHNKEMLLDWEGHINVEFCGKVYAVMYLYNYLFKGYFLLYIFFFMYT